MTTTKTDDLPDEDNDDEDTSDAESEGSLLTALASTTIAESEWKLAPCYPPLYLSTVAEYLPPQPKKRFPKDIVVEDPRDHENSKKKDQDISWAKETYEDSLEVDQVFEKFSKRVEVEGEQCVRFVVCLLLTPSG